MYLNREEAGLALKFNTLKSDKMKAAVKKFWKELLRSCNQLQEEDLIPLSFWHSHHLGLVGVVQKVSDHEWVILWVPKK